MQTPPANLYEFGDFQLDAAKRRLRRLDGTPVPLTPRVFDTLLYMLQHHDSVLDKERIMEAVWPDSIVEENNLAQAISKLRQVFGETPGSNRYIATVPGRGYRFVAEVNQRTATPPAPQHSNVAEAVLIPSAQPAQDNARIEQRSLTGMAVPITQRRATPWPRPAKTAWPWVALSAVAVLALAGLLLGRHRNVPGAAPVPISSVS